MWDVFQLQSANYLQIREDHGTVTVIIKLLQKCPTLNPKLFTQSQEHLKILVGQKKKKKCLGTSEDYSKNQTWKDVALFLVSATSKRNNPTKLHWRPKNINVFVANRRACSSLWLLNYKWWKPREGGWGTRITVSF